MLSAKRQQMAKNIHYEKIDFLEKIPLISLVFPAYVLITVLCHLKLLFYRQYY